ncbi:Hypothetical_protein [Hexamita inflata]|uniref:Hypothetical_protein n=1 Tax=Hexamita inflata TaxID=28002 RepID=A0AA86P7Q8_9EUKA|nr:Hypothetical protein HINF_LOCUS20893 [Hexamita inflata]
MQFPEPILKVYPSDSFDLKAFKLLYQYNQCIELAVIQPEIVKQRSKIEKQLRQLKVRDYQLTLNNILQSDIIFSDYSATLLITQNQLQRFKDADDQLYNQIAAQTVSRQINNKSQIFRFPLSPIHISHLVQNIKLNFKQITAQQPFTCHSINKSTRLGLEPEPTSVSDDELLLFIIQVLRTAVDVLVFNPNTISVVPLQNSVTDKLGIWSLYSDLRSERKVVQKQFKKVMKKMQKENIAFDCKINSNSGELNQQTSYQLIKNFENYNGEFQYEINTKIIYQLIENYQKHIMKQQNEIKLTAELLYSKIDNKIKPKIQIPSSYDNKVEFKQQSLFTDSILYFQQYYDRHTISIDKPALEVIKANYNLVGNTDEILHRMLLEINDPDIQVINGLTPGQILNTIYNSNTNTDEQLAFWLKPKSTPDYQQEFVSQNNQIKDSTLFCTNPIRPPSKQLSLLLTTLKNEFLLRKLIKYQFKNVLDLKNLNETMQRVVIINLYNNFDQKVRKTGLQRNTLQFIITFGFNLNQQGELERKIE